MPYSLDDYLNDIRDFESEGDGFDDAYVPEPEPEEEYPAESRDIDVPLLHMNSDPFSGW